MDKMGRTEPNWTTTAERHWLSNATAKTWPKPKRDRKKRRSRGEKRKKERKQEMPARGVEDTPLATCRKSFHIGSGSRPTIRCIADETWCSKVLAICCLVRKNIKTLSLSISVLLMSLWPSLWRTGTKLAANINLWGRREVWHARHYVQLHESEREGDSLPDFYWLSPPMAVRVDRGECDAVTIRHEDQTQHSPPILCLFL